jgi:hypothetical protein
VKSLLTGLKTPYELGDGKLPLFRLVADPLGWEITVHRTAFVSQQRNACVKCIVLNIEYAVYTVWNLKSNKSKSTQSNPIWSKRLSIIPDMLHKHHHL